VSLLEAVNGIGWICQVPKTNQMWASTAEIIHIVQVFSCTIFPAMKEPQKHGEKNATPFLFYEHNVRLASLAADALW